jgi:glutamine synthetase
LVAAGTLGIRENLQAPRATSEDLSLLSAPELETRGLKRLPEDLGGALAALEADARFRGSFPDRMPAIYAAHKNGELDHVSGMTQTERHAAYSRTY